MQQLVCQSGFWGFSGVFVSYCVQVCSVSHTVVGEYAAWRPSRRVFGCIVSDTAVYRYPYGLSCAILAVQFWQCHFGGRTAILAVYAKSYSVCEIVQCMRKHTVYGISYMYARPYRGGVCEGIQCMRGHTPPAPPLGGRGGRSSPRWRRWGGYAIPVAC